MVDRTVALWVNKSASKKWQ